MGLPLYVPPVESDLRDKNTNPSAQNANRIRRTRRRSSDALREIRRRAILTEAMSQAVTTAHTDLAREQWQSRHLSRMRLERQARALESDPLHQIALNHTQRHPIQTPVHREPDEIMGIMQRHQERARLLLSEELNSTTDPVYEERLQRYLAHIQAPGQSPYPGAARGANPAASASASASATASAPYNPRPAPPPVRHQTDPRGQSSGMPRPRGPSTHEIAPTPSYGQSIASTDQPTASEHYSNTFVGALTHELAQASEHSQQPHWAGEGPFPMDDSDQPPRIMVDHFMGFDEPEPQRPRRRYTSSLRRVTGAPNSSARRPTVGWLDSANPPSASAGAGAGAGASAGAGSGAQPSSSSASRIFGDSTWLRNGPESTSARRLGWAVRYMDANSNSNNNSNNNNSRNSRNSNSNSNSNLPSIHDLLSNSQVDGLGDRRRSLSPEGDGVWDTLLTTLTPDPQPPSLSSSFASTSEALAAAATQEQATSSQPTVVPTPDLSAPPAAPSPTAPASLPAATSRAQPAAAGTASQSTGSASPVEGSSGRTSASASQRVRSPFTAVSAGTDTGDESAVLGGVGADEEDGCDDMDMDRRHEEFELDEDEEDEEEQAEFLGLSSRPSLAQIGHLRPNAGMARQRLMQEQMQRGYPEQAPGYPGPDNTSQRSRPAGNGPHQTEEALDLLGIGGMQHIVRSLARREDIPDEWWAEAGLSRTLSREEAN